MLTRCSIPNAFALAGLCLLVSMGGTSAQHFPEPESQRHIPLEKLSTSELEQYQESISDRLESLSNFTMRSGMGAIGYRSLTYEESVDTEWIQIDLDETTLIDEIVLVPIIWRSSRKGLESDAFPIAFRIIVGTPDNPAGTVVASYSRKDRLLPRIAPLLIPCSGIRASWIRLEALELSPRAWDGKFLLQLSEILVFRGSENIALGKTVTSHTRDSSRNATRQPKFMVDGFMPYLMDSSQGTPSKAFVSKVGIRADATLTLDLGKVIPLDQVNLHTTDVTDTIPQSSPTGHGLPPHFIVEAATRKDFSDAITLFEYRVHSALDIGPVIMRHFQPTFSRYVRIRSLQPYIADKRQGPLIGFAEVEVLHQGNNQSLGARVSTNFNDSYQDLMPARLTDGHNLYGKILPVRDWLSELEQRHELERTRPLIAEILKKRYARQRLNLNLLLWITAILFASTVIILLVASNRQQRAIQKTRDRIAADLHDELGAHLHAIGLLSDMAYHARTTPHKLASLLPKLRTLTKRTGAAARSCTNILESTELYEDLEADMRKTADRLLIDLDYQIHFKGRKTIRQISRNNRIDICLFHKEALTNIIRHSEATRVSISLISTPAAVKLSIMDNGHGMPAHLKGTTPASLTRRSRLLGARVEVSTPDTGIGTRITLVLNNRAWGIFK